MKKERMKMIYRVYLRVGCWDAMYDFQDIQSAADFVTTAMTHQVECEDTKKKRSMKIVVIDPSIEVEDDE